MKIVAITPGSERLYILKDQREDAPEDQIRWYVRSLPTDEYYEAQNALVRMVPGANGGMETDMRIGAHELKVLKGGLVRVENFPDAQGHDIGGEWPNPDSKYVGDEKKRGAFLARIPHRYKTEVARAIITEASVLTEEEAGNSASPSGSA